MDLNMTEQRALKYREALDEGLVQAMDNDSKIFVMGCGVDDEGGIFGTTKAAFEKFGKSRVMDTPLAENAIAGIGVGASIMGNRPVIVHARNDFLFLAMDQIINHAAKWNIMSGGKIHCPMLVRAVVGRGWGQAAQHSQSLHSFFSHIPGLKVMLPATAYDAKGMLLASLKDKCTVISIEHRLLYETQSAVPVEPYVIPLGRGDIKRKGNDITIVALSYMVKEALDAAEVLSKEGIDVEIIDPRCTSPLDIKLILQSVRKTKHLLVTDTSWASYGVSAEISARVYEEAFGFLEAPITRIALPDVNTPCASNLEKEFYPGKEDLIEAVRITLGVKTEQLYSTKSHSVEHEKFAGPF
jgi:acetoin:2,6-dichlorophenolindophenol oxidoreductase subunit beta